MINDRTIALSIGSGIALGLVMALQATELPHVHRMTTDQLREHHREGIRMGIEDDWHKFPDRSHLLPR